jgi:pimeloyl-ACP methyl ester carboxylesterase
MAYRELGSGEPVVLIHGWPQHSQMWHSIAPPISERYHVLAPDLRGSGGTTVKGPKAAMAGDVLRLMDLLQIGQARVVGYALGAGVAYDLAARHPDRVRCLAFIEFRLPGFGYEHEMTAKPDWHAGSLARRREPASGGGSVAGLLLRGRGAWRRRMSEIDIAIATIASPAAAAAPPEGC